MATIVKVRLTEYYPFQSGLTKKQKKMEGGVVDRMGKPLYSLEDYMDGNAPYVSLACDKLGGPPANAKEFRSYGFKVWLPDLAAEISSYIDTPVILPVFIEFRLVDTGEAFTGDKKREIDGAVAPGFALERFQISGPEENHSRRALATSD